MKKLSILLLTFILGVTLILPAPVFAFDKLFYYFENEYGYDSFRKNYDEIDILAPQVYEVGYDYKIKKLSSKAKKILKEADRKKADVMPLIVNDDFSKVLMSGILIKPEVQESIIDFMIEEAKKNDYIGWQFDFENINHLDRDLYTAFVKKTYEALKAEDLQFSVAVVVRSSDYNPNDKNQDWSSAYDYKNLAKYSDFLTLMTYDDPNSIGPVASLPYVNRILDYMLTQAPAEKLSLGVPLYCWQWHDEIRGGSTTYRLAEKAYRKGKNRERGFDENLGAEYFKYDVKKTSMTVWCDNQESVEIKEKLAIENGLRGLSFWALGQEDSDIWK